MRRTVRHYGKNGYTAGAYPGENTESPALLHYQISQKYQKTDLLFLYFSFMDEINEGYFTFSANCVQIKPQENIGPFLPGGTG